MIPAKDLNVVITSVPRCASGWVLEKISEAHKQIYNLPLFYEHLDKDSEKNVAFVDERIEMPQGWYGVYNIHPSLLLKRGFDKVICIRRERSLWIKISYLYYIRTVRYQLEKGILDFKYVQEMDKKQVLRCFSGQWDSLYSGLDGNHDRFYLLDLDELNNHTRHTFYELCDFLEFRHYYRMVFGRPILMVVKPNRNWEKYSADLPRYQEYTESLNIIGELFDKTLHNMINEEIEEFEAWVNH